jgi:hypothetical protein
MDWAIDFVHQSPLGKFISRFEDIFSMFNMQRLDLSAYGCSNVVGVEQVKDIDVADPTT